MTELRDKPAITLSHFADAALLRACSEFLAALQPMPRMRPFNVAVSRAFQTYHSPHCAQIHTQRTKPPDATTAHLPSRAKFYAVPSKESPLLKTWSNSSEASQPIYAAWCLRHRAGVVAVQRLNARIKARASEYPSNSDISVISLAECSSNLNAKAIRV